MSEMIERVARALCRQYEIDDGFSPEQADRAAASEMHRNFIKAARAAVEALSKPTEEMICEGDEHIIEALHDHGGVRRDPTPAEGAWRAMVRAAL